MKIEMQNKQIKIVFNPKEELPDIELSGWYSLLQKNKPFFDAEIFWFTIFFIFLSIFGVFFRYSIFYWIIFFLTIVVLIVLSTLKIWSSTDYFVEEHIVKPLRKMSRVKIAGKEIEYIPESVEVEWQYCCCSIKMNLTVENTSIIGWPFA